MDLKKIIRNIPDFPKPGIQFKDIESITENPDAFAYVVNEFAKEVRKHVVDKILVLDARGFLFGAALGLQEKLPIVMARKTGKLGGECVTEAYSLEYGEAEIQLQKTAIQAGDKVAIVDDLLATAVELVRKVGGEIKVIAVVIELGELGGREKLAGANVLSLVSY